MQVKLSEEELRQQMELESYDRIKEEELEEKRRNDKEKRKKADKKFQLVVFGLIGLTMLVVLIRWLILY